MIINRQLGILEKQYLELDNLGLQMDNLYNYNVNRQKVIQSNDIIVRKKGDSQVTFESKVLNELDQKLQGFAMSAKKLLVEASIAKIKIDVSDFFLFEIKYNQVLKWREI